MLLLNIAASDENDDVRRRITGKDIARCRCVCRAFRRVVDADEVIWSMMLAEDFAFADRAADASAWSLQVSHLAEKCRAWQTEIRKQVRLCSIRRTQHTRLLESLRKLDAAGNAGDPKMIRILRSAKDGSLGQDVYEVGLWHHERLHVQMQEEERRLEHRLADIVRNSEKLTEGPGRPSVSSRDVYACMAIMFGHLIDVRHPGDPSRTCNFYRRAQRIRLRLESYIQSKGSAEVDPRVLGSFERMGPLDREQITMLAARRAGSFFVDIRFNQATATDAEAKEEEEEEAGVEASDARDENEFNALTLDEVLEKVQPYHMVAEPVLPPAYEAAQMALGGQTVDHWRRAGGVTAPSRQLIEGVLGSLFVYDITFSMFLLSSSSSWLLHRALLRIHEGAIYEWLRSFIVVACSPATLSASTIYMIEIKTGRMRCFDFPSALDLAAAGTMRGSVFETDGGVAPTQELAESLVRESAYVYPEDGDEDGANTAPSSFHGDDLLRWLENHCSRLEDGMLAPGRVGCISGMPCYGDRTSVAVTRGVEVRASVAEILYAPGASRRQLKFTYQIQFRLLSRDEQRQRGERPIESVQLLGRHWRIRDGSGRIETVEGEAVIGEHPRLLAGGPSFKYNSLTFMDESGGDMRGHFTFVEGTLATPLSDVFECECAPFPLIRSRGEVMRF